MPRRTESHDTEAQAPPAPASKKLPKKAAKPAAATHPGKDNGAHAASHSKEKGKHVEKHVEMKKPAPKGKAPEKVSTAAEPKGKAVELKPAQKLAAARAAAAATVVAADSKPAKGKKGSAELIN